MTTEWEARFDPLCRPAAEQFRDDLIAGIQDDQGVPLPDILVGWAHLHIANCPRCQSRSPA